jgi:hypothetical protein
MWLWSTFWERSRSDRPRIATIAKYRKKMPKMTAAG